MGTRLVTRRMPMAVGWGLAALLIGLFCMLGAWQLARAERKDAMLADVRQVLASRSAVPLSAAADGARVGALDWARGAGRFADAPAILLDNQIRESRPGVRVYRVFVPDSGTPLLVDLGWLPLPPDRRLPVIVPLPRTLQVSGLLAPPPSAGIATPGITVTADGSLLAIGLDRDVLSEALRMPGLAPRVLKLDPDLPIGYARDLDILPNTLPPQRHVGYAVQWFGLAAAVLVIAVVMTLRQRRRRPGAREKIQP